MYLTLSLQRSMQQTPGKLATIFGSRRQSFQQYGERVGRLAGALRSLGLAGVTPEEQQIVTGAVLIATLTLFGAYGFLRSKAAELRRSRAPVAAPGQSRALSG